MPSPSSPQTSQTEFGPQYCRYCEQRIYHTYIRLAFGDEEIYVTIPDRENRTPASQIGKCNFRPDGGTHVPRTVAA